MEVNDKMKKPTKKTLEKLLSQHQKQYDQIKAEIRDIAFICKGSLIQRSLPCGNPNCRCHKDPKHRHGPYYQLSWKEKGKSMAHFVSPDLVHLYREWINNRIQLMDLITQMEAVSRKAAECVRTMNKTTPKATKTSRTTPKKST